MNECESSESEILSELESEGERVRMRVRVRVSERGNWMRENEIINEH